MSLQQKFAHREDDDHLSGGGVTIAGASMRTRAASLLGIGTVAVGTWLGVHLLLGRRREAVEVVTGTFGNGIGYARLGTGAQSLLWVGGPSVGAPGGLYLKMMTRMLRPFVREGYTVWLLSLRPNLPDGCTVADMADDYAELVAEQFNGKVDVVVGDSAAGLIGFSLAARHSDVFGHIVIVVPGPMTDAANAANLELARLLSAGRKTDAAAVLVTLQRPDIRSRWLIRLLARVVARVGLAAPYEPRDMLVAAEALNAFDGHEILPSIPVPVLLVCGEKDRWATKESYEQAAGLIPDCTLKMYEDKDHLGAMFDKRLPRDVLDFVRQSRPVAGAGSAAHAGGSGRR